MAQCADSRLREALACVASDVENGLPLSDALARHPREFPRLFVAMIRSGEAGGVLDEVLERLASVLERDRAVRKRIVSSLTYPAVVSCAAVALVFFLLVSIVPMFRAMYEQMHVPLPPITSALIWSGTSLQSPLSWMCIAGAAIAAISAFLHFGRNERTAAAVERALARVPIAGDIIRKSTLARLARMLGTLLHSGIGLVAATEIVSDVVSSVAHRQSLATLRRCLAEGSAVSEPLARTGLYEPIFLQFVRVGEETGALDAMLLRLADYYDVDVEAALSSLASLLEPAMIVILGGAVGFIVSAIFIPLYSLIGNMK
jgi:type IV pilus assembly protein PilC